MVILIISNQGKKSEYRALNLIGTLTLIEVLFSHLIVVHRAES